MSKFVALAVLSDKVLECDRQTNWRRTDICVVGDLTLYGFLAGKI